MILDDITTNTRTQVAERKRRVSLAEMRTRAETAPPLRDFASALQREHAALIAEVKRASPSRGMLMADLDPIQLARTYASSGASAISVLTDNKYFRGSLADLEAVRASVDLPVLCKDFAVDEYQIYEARAHGADAILLIVRILSDVQLHDYLELARSLGLGALAEVHDLAELDRALGASAPIIGINNRNLADFTVSLETTERLAPHIPSDKIIVAESGIFTRADVERVDRVGAHAVLVGEALVRSEDIATKVKKLAGVKRKMVQVKICGITNLEDALVAAEAGADMLGLVFFPRSPRYIEPQRAGELVAAFKQHGHSPRFVGVFVNESLERVREIAAIAQLDVVQLHGNESPEMMKALGTCHPEQSRRIAQNDRHVAGSVCKALRPRDASEAQSLVAQYRAAVNGNIPAFVVDAFDAQQFGGTGQRADWDIAAQIAREFPILLAGGLNAGNVAEAIRAVRPWGVDVSSGVERMPGVKDYNKVRQFIRAARTG